MQLGCQFWGQSYSPCLDDATSQECFNFQAENGERDASETNTPQNPTEAELLAPGDTENPSLDGMDTTSLLDPAEQEVGNTPSVPTEDPGEVILSINEIS